MFKDRFAYTLFVTQIVKRDNYDVVYVMYRNSLVSLLVLINVLKCS